jgi:hypothetical protein
LFFEGIGAGLRLALGLRGAPTMRLVGLLDGFGHGSLLHSKEVADSHHTKPLPDETRRTALKFDSALVAGIANKLFSSLT